MRKKKNGCGLMLFIALVLIALIIMFIVLIINKTNDYKDSRTPAQISSQLPESSEEEPDPHAGMELITLRNSRSVDGSLMLVNKDYGVPKKYEAADYPSMYDEEHTYGVRSKEMYLQPVALDNMKEMLKAAADDGITDMLLVDGYRLNEKQEKLFYGRIEAQMEKGLSKEEATAKIAETVAYPGHSEHQIGLAIDTDLSVEYEDFAETDFAKWTIEHCYEYGFVLRYPADKEDITDITYEPWHYRYVGRIHAEYMTKNELCLEEYIELLHDKGVIKYEAEDGTDYTITYVEMADGDETECWIPENSKYEYSSDNTGGFVVLSWEKK